MDKQHSETAEKDDHVPDDQELAALSASVSSALLSSHATCATAESCTGGMVAKLLTDIAGSSQWFSGGFVCYSNLTKNSMLDVPRELIDTNGAVSREVVQALSANVIGHVGVDVGVAISGVAGPGGGSQHKPVGTVWIGWSTRLHNSESLDGWARHFLFKGNRDQIRRAAAGRALRGILDIMNSG